MNKKSFLISFFTFWVLTTNLILGQINYCGTDTGIYLSTNQKNFEATFSKAQVAPNQSVSQVNRTLLISLFLVKENNAPAFNEARLPIILDSLNRYFEPIALRFKFCSIQHVNNFQFDMLDANTNANDLRVQYSEPNTINLYLVTSITDMRGSSVNGYTYMPGDVGKNCIFAIKRGLIGSVLAHQLGHFLNLYHPHETAFGKELPDGTNCSTTGDFCCDTNASPDLSITGMVSASDCTYTGNVKVSNQFYSPSTKNMMALSKEDCHCVFSKTQFLRMVNTLNNYRKDLR